MYFFNAIFTSAKCYKLIRMCQPQSSLWCFSRTVAASADSHYKWLSFFSFNIWRKYSIFLSGLYKPSKRRRNLMRYSRRIRSPAKSEFSKRTYGGNSRRCVTDRYCAKISLGGDRKKEYQAVIGLVIWEGVCGRSLFAKWDIFVNAVFLEIIFRLIGPL